MLRKLKAVTMLIALATVMFVGAMLVAPAPVQADHCAKKEAKSCDKDKGSEEKSDDPDKGCDKGKGSEENDDPDKK